MIVICIPAYYEESSIAYIISKTLQHADKVIVCDDGLTLLTTVNKIIAVANFMRD